MEDYLVHKSGSLHKPFLRLINIKDLEAAGLVGLLVQKYDSLSVQIRALASY